MDTQSEEFEVDYSKLKADVALMRANCITRQDLKQELAAMEQRLVECINGLGRRMDKRFEDVDKRFEGVDRRFDEMNKRFDGIDRRLGATEAKFEGLASRFDTERPHLATKADMHAAHGQMYMWMIGSILTIILGFVGLGFTIVSALKPTAMPVPVPTAVAHTRIIPADVRAIPRRRAA